jgi:hypothetical protein
MMMSQVEKRAFSGMTHHSHDTPPARGRPGFTHLILAPDALQGP